MTQGARDHGGRLDAAIARYGGARPDWLDLSTGINPMPYPLGDISDQAWTNLPDQGAFGRLITAARQFWSVPGHATILPAPGASALIARMPVITTAQSVAIAQPTYNEHAAAFDAAGHTITQGGADVQVVVHPNNPDGRFWDQAGLVASHKDLTIIDESFCDIAPERSLIDLAAIPGFVVLKSFGKFWGLAGLRLGFAIAHPDTLAPLRDALGPWQVSGPALEIGARALGDAQWADETRAQLKRDAARLDQLVLANGATLVGGTTLFRLYDTDDAAQMAEHLAAQKILVRPFPYNPRWLRFGLPGTPEHWAQLEGALA